MHGTFVAAGPGIKASDIPVPGVRAVDLAPTLSFLLGIPGPQNARGRIMYELTASPGRYKEITVLDISDYHGQLVPLAETADNLASPAVNPTFAIGGSAFLKPWFDLYRSEAPNGSVVMAAGDSVGATPPISAFFGDIPTIEQMNLMGFQIDGLGNHNFDKGSAYLRNTLIPLANFPYVSANVVDAQGKTPAEWSPSHVFDTTFGGGKVGFVGFTNEDAPELVFPGSFDPFHVDPRLARVQAEVNRLRSKNVKTIIVMGHDGATAGTLTSPTGPLIDLADQLTGVDAVIGDHTNFQVLTTRPNGTLVTENLSKGVRFTRVRLVLDSTTQKVIYKTADFHKPWTIGVTPDPTIQARDRRTQYGVAPDPRDGHRHVIGPDPAFRRVRARGWPPLRIARRQRDDRRDAHQVRVDRRRVRHHELGWAARRADLRAGRWGQRLLPAVDAAALPHHPGPGPRGAAVRQHRRDRPGQRRRAEDDAGERRLAHAGSPGAVPAGVGPVLHVQHRGCRRQSRDRRRTPGGGRFVHRRRDRPDRGFDLPHRRERLHGQRRRRLSELLQSPGHPGHHGSDAGRLRHGELAAGAVDPGSDQVHRPEPGSWQQLPGGFAVTKPPVPSGMRRIGQGGLGRPVGLMGARSLRVGITLATLAMWLVALAPAVQAHGGTATLQLPTPRVNPGGTLELLGDMTAEGPVELYLIAADSVVRSLGNANADAEGHFQAFIALPRDLPTGSYEVAARSAVDRATTRLVIDGIPVAVGDEGQLPGRDDIFAGSGVEPRPHPSPHSPS